MRFCTTTHQYYCGIDLHTRVMYLCILDSDGKIVLHRNMNADPESLLKAIDPFRPDVVVGIECIFTWYWMADLCAREEIPFVLGHALYMKAIHGGKAKNDKIRPPDIWEFELNLFSENYTFFSAPTIS